jgi:hypothetical protein
VNIAHRISRKNANVEAINLYILIIFCFSLPFTRSLSSIFLTIFILTTVSHYLFDKYKKLQKDSTGLCTRTFKLDIFLTPLIVYFFLNIISIIYTSPENFNGGLKIVEKNLAFLILPIAFSLFRLRTREEANVLLKSFVLGNIVASFLCIIKAVEKSFTFGDNSWVFKPYIARRPNLGFFESVNVGGNFFFSDNLSAFIHPTYFSMLILLSVIIVWQIEIRFKPLLYFFLCLMLYLLSSRGAILSATILATVIFLYHFLRLERKKKAWQMMVFTLCLLGVSIFLSHNPRSSRLINNIKEFNYRIDPTSVDNFQVRLMTLDAGIEVIKSSPVIGVGPADLGSALRKVYTEKGYLKPLEKNLTVHNQFLSDFSKHGIIGILTLCIIFFTSFKEGWKKNNLFLLSIGVIFSVNSLFEAVFTTYAGIVPFAFFYCLFFTSSYFHKNLPNKIEESVR